MKHLRSTLGATVLGAVTALSFSAGALTAATTTPAAASTPAGAIAIPQATPPVATVAPAVAARPTSATASRPRHRPSADRGEAVRGERATSRTAAAPTRAQHRTRSSTSAGCGQRAVSSGVFNPSCSEYQGYLDPGRSAGRAPSSSDIQGDWAACTAVKSDAQCRR